MNPRGSPALFPPMHGSNDYLVGNSVREILNLSLRELGIDADPRILRRTFGQRYLDSGIDSIESVSVLMGHSTTQTTETFYARRRNDRAIEEARKTFRVANPTVVESSENNGQQNENKGDGAGEGIRTLETLR